jgi:hypothetical protein
MVNFDCWDYVKRTPDINVLPSTWAFKLKRYPDERVKNSRPDSALAVTGRRKA